MQYQVSADLLQAIVNILNETPAKVSFNVLKAIDILVAEQSKPKEEKKDD
jgi:hypothetical protein